MTTVKATIQELDALLADDSLDRCCVKTLARILLAFTHLRACQRPAVAVVTVTCAEHGPDAWPVCPEHLRKIRKYPSLLHCGTCRQPAVLADVEISR